MFGFLGALAIASLVILGAIWLADNIQFRKRSSSNPDKGE